LHPIHLPWPVSTQQWYVRGTGANEGSQDTVPCMRFMQLSTEVAGPLYRHPQGLLDLPHHHHHHSPTSDPTRRRPEVPARWRHQISDLWVPVFWGLVNSRR